MMVVFGIALAGIASITMPIEVSTDSTMARYIFRSLACFETCRDTYSSGGRCSGLCEAFYAR
jgi:hypothetical protein